mgnify:CR=1 FL=1
MRKVTKEQVKKVALWVLVGIPAIAATVSTIVVFFLPKKPAEVTEEENQDDPDELTFIDINEEDEL